MSPCRTSAPAPSPCSLSRQSCLSEDSAMRTSWDQLRVKHLTAPTLSHRVLSGETLLPVYWWFLSFLKAGLQLWPTTPRLKRNLITSSAGKTLWVWECAMAASCSPCWAGWERERMEQVRLRENSYIKHWILTLPWIIYIYIYLLQKNMEELSLFTVYCK